MAELRDGLESQLSRGDLAEIVDQIQQYEKEKLELVLASLFLVT